MTAEERKLDAKLQTETAINKSNEKQALTELDNTYGIQNANGAWTGQIGAVDTFFNDQINDLKEGTTALEEAANQQTQQTIKEINQQKDNTYKDYLKEQSGAYVDWQKQSNPYGANAEQMASAGLAGSGYSESSLVSMYNQYQNRVATARVSYERAVQSYNNAIAQAQIQNNSILAEIAYEALQKQLELSLQGFQYKNTLILEKAKAKREVQSEYYQRYLNILQQINQEKALAEEKRQFDAQLAEEQRQFDRQHGGISVGGSSGSRSSGKKTSSTPSITNVPSKIKSDEGVEIYYVEGYGTLEKYDFERLYKKGLIVEHKKDGKLTYRATVPKTVIEKLGISL